MANSGPKRKRHPGERFNSWTLKERLDTSNWIAVCDCGTEQEVQIASLTSGRSKGCMNCRTARGMTKYAGLTKKNAADHQS